MLDGRARFVAVDDLEGLIAAAEAAVRPAPIPPPWTWRDAAEKTWEVYQEAAAAPPVWRGARRRRPRTADVEKA
jgi:hypothetical protein